jgi:hypothetical protein
MNPILPNKFHLILGIKIFPTTPKAHSNSSKKIQLRLNLVFSEEIISIFRNFCTASPNIMEPSPCTHQTWKAFQRHQEHDLKNPGSMDLITTKQNKLPFFLD